MTADRERAALLRAVLDAPEDDGPRLAFADWLDENGDPDRAEFIRVQCAESALPSGDPLKWELLERSQQLRDRHAARWFAEVWGEEPDEVRPARGGAWLQRIGRRLGVRLPARPWRVTPLARWSPEFNRGFVSFVHLPVDELLRRAAALAERARFTDVAFYESTARPPASSAWLAGLFRLPLLRAVRSIHTYDPFVGAAPWEELADPAVMPRLSDLFVMSPAAFQPFGRLVRVGAFGRLRTLLLNFDLDPPVGPGEFRDGFGPVAGTPQAAGLSNVTVWFAEGADADASPLTASPHVTGLKAVRLDGLRTPPAAVAALLGGGAPALESLSLRGAYGVTHPPAPDAPPPARLAALKWLRLSNCGLDGHFLVPLLGGLPNLTDLDLYNNDLGGGSAVGLAALPFVSRLKTLALHRTRIDDDAARRLADALGPAAEFRVDQSNLSRRVRRLLTARFGPHVFA